MLTKKNFSLDLWPEIYASRQNQSILTWAVTGIEEISLKDSKTLCMVVSQERIKGLIPLEESGVNPAENKNITRSRLMNLIGQDVKIIVIGIDKENDLFIASRKKAIEKLSAVTWDSIESGQIKTAIARRIVRRRKNDGTVTDLGLMIEISGIETFLPVQELSYGWVNEILSLIQPGDIFDVLILDVDKEKQKLSVSVKALYENPWPSCVNRYTKNSAYAGTVTGVAEYGIFVNLEPGVDVLCRHPKSGRVNKGDKVALIITRIDPSEQKINGIINRILRRS
ncbi:MAG: S1 RNA-binding domain-containing protein [Syntrophomonadaceae bacterium]|nr:S1 RNA-binding domain-containing protein [Syntrophomonadaceae bacterium]MDD4550031.1 S1 RNA-binding domain-containing protein [Syntrophomonadaceae bacterium]